MPAPAPAPSASTPAPPAFEALGVPPAVAGGGPGRSPGYGKGRGGEGAARRAPHRTPTGPRDRGQVAIEYIAFVPILLFVALAGIQLGVVAYAEEQAGTAARTAARVQARDGEGGVEAGKAALSDWLADDATVDVPPGGDAITATVTVRVPSVLPGLDGHVATRTAVMPNDDPKEARP
ncbi:TadE/TadG family type IV pilus assembly protein [Streptomyces sp. NPDC090022]|uniref:TadE/TadG family type IV pilus assembly protein n=1 Tax=Streptomyces sp. NPDC090022 TaxID=3365920 RepID=UPI00381A0836